MSKLKNEATQLYDLPIDVQREIKLQQLEIDKNLALTARFAGGGGPPGFGPIGGAPLSPNGEGKSFARGGNGIFGEAKSEEQKRTGEKYKEELKQQIEEKKRREAAEKEKIRIEEEKEMKRFEEQQKRIKAELEEEERRKREKDQKETLSKVDTNIEIAQKRKNGPKGRKFDSPATKKDKPPSPRPSPPPFPVVSF